MATIPAEGKRIAAYAAGAMPMTGRRQLEPSMKHSVALSALVAALTLAPAEAQVVRLAAQSAPQVLQVEGEVASPEKLRLLVGLAEIRADLQLGLLFVQEDLVHPEGSHFAHAREVVLTGFAEGLSAAGVPDLAPLLQTLEAAKSAEAVKAAYNEAEAALLRARATLAPSPEEVLQSVVEMTKVAAAKLDASGTTAVADYQFAWATLMVARGELDLLSRDQDRAIAKMAGDEAMAFDDVILFMPDPHQLAPVAFDPALILDLVKKLEATAQAA